MIVVGVYSFKNGKEVIEQHYAAVLQEVYEIISTIDSDQHKSKVSAEKTMPGKALYSPIALNAAIKKAFYDRGWDNHRVICDYPTQFYTSGYQPRHGGAANPFARWILSRKG